MRTRVGQGIAPSDRQDEVCIKGWKNIEPGDGRQWYSAYTEEESKWP